MSELIYSIITAELWILGLITGWVVHDIVDVKKQIRRLTNND